MGTLFWLKNYTYKIYKAIKNAYIGIYNSEDLKSQMFNNTLLYSK